MEKLKKLMTKKYFFVIFFFVIVVILAFALHISIDDDIKRSQPTDDMPRVEATVLNYPDSYTTEENNRSVEMYSGIQIEVTLNDTEKHITFLSGTAPKSVTGPLEIGSKIKVKYDPTDHDTYYIVDDPAPHYRVFLYIVYIVLILGCIGATIYFFKVAEVRAQKKLVEENMRKVREQHEADTEAMSGGYRGLDGTEDPANAVDPFANDTTDYNAIYQQNKSLDDAEYSTEGTYSSFGSPMDAPYDPNTAYTGQDNGGSISPDDLFTPGTAAKDANEADPKGSAEEQSDAADDYSSYGMPNVSMDAPYDPNVNYSDYGMPNASMDAPYDPNAPYTGY